MSFLSLLNAGEIVTRAEHRGGAPHGTPGSAAHRANHVRSGAEGYRHGAAGGAVEVIEQPPVEETVAPSSPN